jgi:hypothetical protein
VSTRKKILRRIRLMKRINKKERAEAAALLKSTFTKNSNVPELRTVVVKKKFLETVMGREITEKDASKISEKFSDVKNLVIVYHGKRFSVLSYTPSLDISTGDLTDLLVELRNSLEVVTPIIADETADTTKMDSYKYCD